LVAVGQDDYGHCGIYTSLDSGATWVEAHAPVGNWQLAAASADASKIVALAYDGPVGILHLPASPPPPLRPPRLTFGRLGADLGISWLVPSTSFVLQQNPDLSTTNWTDVPTPPKLNLTNLNYELTVSPTPDQNFYRLKQQ
jgi:hypothetical protein